MDHLNNYVERFLELFSVIQLIKNTIKAKYNINILIYNIKRNLHLKEGLIFSMS